MLRRWYATAASPRARATRANRHGTRLLSTSEPTDAWTRFQVQRDSLVSSFTPGLRLSLVNATETVQRACDRFYLGRTPSLSDASHVAGLPDAHRKMMQVFAETLVGSVLLSSFLDGEERTVLQLTPPADADVGFTRVYAEALRLGEVRGYLSGPGVPEGAPHLDPTYRGPAPSPALLPVSKPGTPLLDWDGSLPPGTLLSVSRMLYNRAQPVSSLVGLTSPGRSGLLDVTSALQLFYDKSEQTPTLVHLESIIVPVQPGVLRVAYAGGLIAQRIPETGGKVGEGAGAGVTPSTLESVAARLAGLASADGGSTATAVEEALRLLHAGEEAGGEVVSASATSPASCVAPSRPLYAWKLGKRTLQDAVKHLLPELASVDPRDKAVFRRTPLDFFCRCTKARFIDSLSKQGGNHLLQEEAARNGVPLGSEEVVAVLTCQYCNAGYPVTGVDVEALTAAPSGGGTEGAAK